MFDSNEVEFLTAKPLELEALRQLTPFAPFNDSAILLLNALGNCIIRDRRSKEFPDLVTFAFWCSYSNLSLMKKKFTTNNYSVGRGIVFHITPGNVPLNFAYSLASGILTGNTNIVKVPSQSFTQIGIFSDCLNMVLDDPTFDEWKSRTFLLRYKNVRQITDALSQICDVRIIWGGDDTINTVRESRLKPKSYDLIFADRYSFSAIKSVAYLEASNQESIATKFYNDVYLFDQNACTSPHLIIWVGDSSRNQLARKYFWGQLSRLVLANYSISAFQLVEKTVAAYAVAATNPRSQIEMDFNGTVTRVLIETLPANIETMRSHSGFFLEYFSNSINDLQSLVTRNFQTMSYFGFEKVELSRFFSQNPLLGIDRVVPIGETLDFSLLWDGYNLVSSLTRQFEIN